MELDISSAVGAMKLELHGADGGQDLLLSADLALARWIEASRETEARGVSLRGFFSETPPA